MNVYIGVETYYLNMKFPHSINITLDKEIAYNNDEIREALINPKENDRQISFHHRTHS